MKRRPRKRTYPLLLAILLTFAVLALGPAAAEEMETAIFAGGCFWCSEADFEKVDGVVSVVSGYIGGEANTARYKRVSAGGTGHAESVKVTYDPSKVTYEDLLEYFWRHIDPTVENRQFCDRGSQYRSGIFYLDEAQRQAAEASRKRLEKEKPFAAEIVTEITAATEFFPAEDYHQDYYKKNATHYRLYRSGCGRDQRLHELWGDER